MIKSEEKYENVKTYGALSLKHQELIINKSQFKTVIPINLNLWLYRLDLI